MSIIPAQVQYATLAGSGSALGATSIILTSFKDITGTVLSMASFGAKGFATIEPNNATQEEQISFSGITQNSNGTATLTGVKTVLFITPFTETSGTTKAHPGGVKLIITNTAGFYNTFANKNNDETITGDWTFDTGAVLKITDAPTAGADVVNKTYADALAIAGVGDMSLTTKGIGEEATTAEIEAGSLNGSVGPLIVNPSYLKASIYSTSLPGVGQKAALAGSSGDPSATNKYITQADVSSVAVSGAIVRAYNTQLPALSGISLVSTNLAGLYIANQAKGDLTYKSTGNGWTRLAAGTSGQFLKTQGAGAAPIWAAPMTFANGTTTRITNAGDGAVNIAHGLGVIPKKVRITAMQVASNVSAIQVLSYNGTTASCVRAGYFGSDVIESVGTTLILYDAAGAANYDTGTVTMDATNIIITYVATASPDDTWYLMWECET